jgi:hypothetical protein
MARNIAVDTKSSESGPAVNAFSIVTNNDLELDYITKSLWVGTGGNVNCVFATAAGNNAGNAVVIANIPTGTELKVRLKKIGADGTTASNLIGFI